LHRNIYDWFSDPENRELLNHLKKEVIIKMNTQPNSKENPFMGKTIVVTDALENFTRDEINSELIRLGAKAGSSVSKNTDYVITGEKAGSKLAKAEALGIPVEKAGSKLAKAEALGIPVLSEMQFIQMAQE
jgi:DNA ligase (NAD+)